MTGLLWWVRSSQPRSAIYGGPSANLTIQTSKPTVESNQRVTNFEGAGAHGYFESTSDGQSLIQTVIAEQYGLKWQERAPDGITKGGGYLGISHDLNMNAWFDEESVTVRPTLAEQDRHKSWKLGFRLKGYGYGKDLESAPPVVARDVKGNRIEYKRSNCHLAIANCQFK
jgi:hypothetical protein